MNRLFMVALAIAPVFAVEAEIKLVSPKQGETVSQLWPKVKEFLDMPRAERKVNGQRISKKEKNVFKHSKSAMPVAFKWTGDENGIYTLTVKRMPDRMVFHSATVTGCTASVAGRLEIARTWEWTVSGGGETATGTFSTEDRAPRIISLDGVRNVRDIGGRIGLGGRRIKQGLVLRTGGLNYNAPSVYYTYDEIIELYKAGKLATAGTWKSRNLGRDYDARLRNGKGIDKNFLRLFKSGPTEPGKERLTAADREYLLGFLGVKSDIDFRNDWECFGMTGSPLGDDVVWHHYNCMSGYGGFVTPNGRASFTPAFSVFLNKDNYPIIFHCIGGTDRTGTFAYLLEGLLGVDEEEMIRDYEMSFIGGGGVDPKHYSWLESLVKAVRELPGDTIPEKVKGYILSLGFTDEEIERVRNFLLEEKPRS